jgi:hypothetical protein
MVSVADGRVTMPWRASVELAVRRLAAITVAGAVLGVLVGGVGGRLAMMLLAALNPRAAGVTSDDGFTIGQLTVGGTAQLLGTAWQLGLVGAFVYALLRGLMIGPRWFRVLSISVGSGVVVGALIVHTDGVDFTLLQPVSLTVGIFVAIPVVYAALLTLLAEHWIAEAGWPARGRLVGDAAVVASVAAAAACSRRGVAGGGMASASGGAAGSVPPCVVVAGARRAHGGVLLAVEDLVSDIRLLS